MEWQINLQYSYSSTRTRAHVCAQVRRQKSDIDLLLPFSYIVNSDKYLRKKDNIIV